jgi:S1-C subfamily serine protease
VKTEKISRKRVAIKPKHAKPYRKRHYALLLTTLAAAFVLFAVVVSIRVHINAAGADTRDFIATTLNKPVASEQAVQSSYGFGFKYDPRRLYASAIDGATGKLYIGYELVSERPYQTIKLSTKAVPQAAADPDTISLEYYQAASSKSLSAIEESYLATARSGGTTPTVARTRTIKQHGLTFQRTEWDVASNGQLGKLTAHFVSYTVLLGDQPLIIRTNNRIGSASNTADIDAIAASLTTGPVTVSYQPATPAISSKLAKSRSLLDQVFFSSAAADNSQLDTQTISALYAPAVVKIYNAYCMDISIKGKLYLSGACSASSGSGFFVSSDGYLATNGHVATANPKDLVIEDAYAAASKGDGKPLVYLAQAAGLSISQLSTISDDSVLLDTIFDAVYNMPDNAFTKSNDVQNLLVGLDRKDPDIDSLLSLTNLRKQYAPSSDIVKAKIVSSDYRASDGIVKYRDSDVALLKLDGHDFPVVKLGALSEVGQGSSLSILGYPAAASDNGIVASHVSEVTLTSGKVSSIKSANGDTRQLIETDTTIGHGNSGGPVLDDAGNVIGIATYTVDGGGKGNGTFNYIRDIQDLKVLASLSNIHFNAISRTQSVWQQAVTAFNTSHYSKSLKYFSQIQYLYPQHPSVDSFVTRAEGNIKAGKDVKDFPVAILIGAAAAALALAGLAIFFIVRHHAKHQVYKLASGQVGTSPVHADGSPTSGYYYPVPPQTVPAAASQSLPQPAPAPVSATHAAHTARSLHR